jgi:NAD(P)-dependent dehydrogenase (short-subunit alcohol dehydrogenase family)
VTASGGGRLAGRIALVTGASRGIGAAVARGFAAEGAHVIATARTVGALEELDDDIQAAGGSVTLVPMDLLDLDAIDRLGLAVHERWGRLDVLASCAGTLGELRPMHQFEPPMWEQVLGVNVTAPQRLVRSFDPLLRAAPSGRAIFVTCAQAEGEQPYWGAYAVSKAALEAMIRSYAAETGRSTVRVNLLDPGPTRTRLRATAFPGEDKATVKPPEAVVPLFVELAAEGCDRHGDRVVA